MNSVRSRGFSLIELMIVLSVIAILTTVGYPSYMNYVVRSSREAAKSELLQFANLQEKIYLNSSSYATSVTTAYNGRADGGLGFTTGTSGDGKYAYTIVPTVGPTNIYTITATPVVTSSQASDGNLVVSSDGTRAWGSKTW